MLRFLRLLVLPLAVLLATAAKAVAADAPFYVVQVQPIDKLLKTVKDFAARFATPQLGTDAEEKTSTEIEEKLTQVLGKGWRDAIDESRPIFLYGKPSSGKKEAPPVLLLPVKGEKAAREHLKGMNVEVEDADNGCQKCKLPGRKETVYFRFANGCLYAAQDSSEPLAEDRLVTPANLHDSREKAALVARFHIDRLPQTLIEEKVKDLQQNIKENTRKSVEGKLPDEVIRKIEKSTEKWWIAFVRHSKELSLRLDLDAASGELHTALRLTPRPDSELAQMLSAIRPGPSLGAALVAGEPLFAVHARLSLPELITSQILSGWREGLKAHLPQVDDEKAQTAYKDLAAAIEPTIEQGVLDAALVMHGSGKQNRYGAVLSLQLKNGPAVEKAARKVIDFLPAKHPLGRLRMDADTIGDTKVHRYPLGDLVPEPIKAIFGKGTAVIAFREEGMLVSYGEGAEELLGKALSVQMRKAPPLRVHAEGDSQRLLDIVIQNDPGSAKNARQLADVLPKRVRILHLSLAGGEALELKVAVNLLVMPRTASTKASSGSKPPAVKTPIPPPPAR
jgi:hypothetical protein